MAGNLHSQQLTTVIESYRIVSNRIASESELGAGSQKQSGAIKIDGDANV